MGTKVNQGYPEVVVNLIDKRCMIILWIGKLFFTWTRRGMNL